MAKYLIVQSKVLAVWCVVLYDDIVNDFVEKI